MIQKVDELLQVIRFDYDNSFRHRNGDIHHGIDFVEIFLPINLMAKMGVGSNFFSNPIKRTYYLGFRARFTGGHIVRPILKLYK